MTLNMPKYLYLIFTSIKHLDLSNFLDISILFFHSKHIKINIGKLKQIVHFLTPREACLSFNYYWNLGVMEK